MFQLDSIQIQTIDYCNRKCDWCPNKYLDKTPDSLMTEEIFYKILSDLKELNYIGAIHPYLMGEPLCDKRFADLVRVIRREFPYSRILINTNGDFLKDRRDVEELIEAGLTDIIINLYDNRNNHLIKEIVGLPGVTIKTISQLRRFFFNRAGLVKGRGRGYKSCSYILDKMCINYRGDVILCCADYFYQVVFGNVMEMKLWDIWNSERYLYYRREHRAGRGHLRPLCSECNYFRHPIIEPVQSEK